MLNYIEETQPTMAFYGRTLLDSKPFYLVNMHWSALLVHA